MAYSLDSQQKVWILSKFGFLNKSKIWDLFRNSRATSGSRKRWTVCGRQDSIRSASVSFRSIMITIWENHGATPLRGLLWTAASLPVKISMHIPRAHLILQVHPEERKTVEKVRRGTTGILAAFVRNISGILRSASSGCRSWGSKQI